MKRYPLIKRSTKFIYIFTLKGADEITIKIHESLSYLKLQHYYCSNFQERYTVQYMVIC